MTEATTAACAEDHAACGHDRCRACEGCADCDREEAETVSQAITTRLIEAAGDIAEAIACANSAYVAFTELTGGWLSDADLTETGAGDDAKERLIQICADLRDVARIIENRQLREQVAALEDDQSA